MNNLLTNAFEIGSIIRRHNITIGEATDLTQAAELVLGELKERVRQARTDIKTLEGLVYDLAPQATREQQPQNGATLELAP